MDNHSEARPASAVDLVQGVMDQRIAQPAQVKSDRDLLGVLVSIWDPRGNAQFTANRDASISLMFASHHQLRDVVVDAHPFPFAIPVSTPGGRNSTTSTPTARR